MSTYKIAIVAALAAASISVTSPHAAPSGGEANDATAEASSTDDGIHNAATPDGGANQVTETADASKPSIRQLKYADGWWKWRGSTVSLRNTSSALSFIPSNDLTYNPEVGLGLAVGLRYWLNHMWSLSARYSAGRDWTQSDTTSRRGEIVSGDVFLAVSAFNFAPLPGGVQLTAALNFRLPTSNISQTQTLMVGLRGNLRVSKTFGKIMQGLTLGYTFGISKNINRYTTSERDTAIIGGCSSSAECSQYLNFGARNVSWGISNSFDITLSMTNWVSVGISFSGFHNFLYSVNTDYDRFISNEPLENEDKRYALFYSIGADFIPWGPLDIDVGIQTFNAQRQPDEDAYAPFFNRNTGFYINFNLDIARLILLAKYGKTPTQSLAQRIQNGTN